LNGIPPFYAETIDELVTLYNNLDEELSEVDWEMTPEPVKDLIVNLLAKDPRKRFTITQCKAHNWIKVYCLTY
jgi:serine/threonine protein kinase